MKSHEHDQIPNSFLIQVMFLTTANDMAADPVSTYRAVHVLFDEDCCAFYAFGIGAPAFPSASMLYTGWYGKLRGYSRTASYGCRVFNGQNLGVSTYVEA